MEMLKQKIAERQPIVGAAVGAGMSASAAEEGEADFLMALSAGYFRSHGCSSMASMMPYSNANKLSWQITTRYILPRIKHIPTFIGICAQDPQLNLDSYLHTIAESGLLGVTNFPSVGFIDGNYRMALEDTGLGFECEVEMLSQARKVGLTTIGFCFTPDEAVAMARAGIDILCLDLGWAEWRDVDFEQHQSALDQAINHINTVIASVKQVTPKPYVAIFGGPVTLPQDTIQIYQRTEALGYMGGSTIERFPATSNITQIVHEFKQAANVSRSNYRLGAMIGFSDSMQKVFEVIRRVAQSDAPVVIIGESGAGKELAAREIHRLSNRSKASFVCWNCGTITESLAMSELFGHERGAFTGAIKRNLGKFELAEGGSLFMDDIVNLPISVQSALLRAIQEKEVLRVGGQESIKVDVRLIASSNQDFSGLINAGLFRLDLYYRLSTVVIKIPPLRERKEDIPFLVWDFAQEFSRKYGCPLPNIPKSFMDSLISHTWPGNIRELRNAIERCFILGQGKTLSKDWLEEIFMLDKGLDKPFAPIRSGSVHNSKRERFPEVLAKHNGNKAAAARELGVTRKTIYSWLKASQ